MSWAHGVVIRDGEEIEVGYGVKDICNQDGCEVEIDRGLYYLCGGMYGFGYGCEKWFCDAHMYLGKEHQLCFDCFDEEEED